MENKTIGLSTIIFVLGFFTTTSAHTYHTGQCPNVEPASDFQMKQFLGVWYAIQKTSTASSCVVYNITRGEEPGEYLIEQTSQHFALGLTPLKHEYSYTGRLSVVDGDVPAKMRVRFPLSVAGSASFTVFMTDYDQYAGIFSCQKVTFAHRRSATILSRMKTLDKIYVDKIRSRLASFSVDPFDLSIISQSDCPKDAKDGVNIQIDPDTFSAANIASGVRKVGEKIGDGIEYAVDAGKKVYNKIRNSGDTDAVTPPTTARMINRDNIQTDPDSEWVPF